MVVGRGGVALNGGGQGPVCCTTNCVMYCTMGSCCVTRGTGLIGCCIYG